MIGRSAEEILDLLDPVAGHLADGGGITWSSVDQVRAQLLLSLGDAEAAERVAVEAVAASRRRGTPLFLARELPSCWRRLGRQLGHDPDEIEPLVGEALAIADADRRGAGPCRTLVRHGLA